jgi:glycosyltransferase EpsD
VQTEVTEVRRILYVATVTTHIRAFHMPFIELLERSGYEVEIACNADVPLPGSRTVWNIPFSRNPYAWWNATASAALRRVLARGYTLIHTRTPVTSFLVRLAARGSDSTVLYRHMASTSTTGLHS